MSEPLTAKEEALYREGLRLPAFAPPASSLLDVTIVEWADRCRRLLATLDAARSERTGLDAAWAEVEAALATLSEGWRGPSVAQDWRGRWYAYVYRHHEDAPRNPELAGHVDAENHDSPAAALRALAARITDDEV